MAKSGHNGAFIVGSILGGAVGAVTALWKTPQSGAELRARLGIEREVSHAASTAKHAANTASELVSGAVAASKPLSSKALRLVETASAPLVGVKLGQTANNSQPAPPDIAAGSINDGSPETGTQPEVAPITPPWAK